MAWRNWGAQRVNLEANKARAVAFLRDFAQCGP